MGLGIQNRVERSYRFTVTVTDCVFRVLPWTVGKSQACWWVPSINIHFPVLWYVSMYYPHFCFYIANFERGTYTPAMRVEMQQTQLHFFLSLRKSAHVWKLVWAPVAGCCQLSFHPREDFCLTHPKGWIDIHRSSRGRNIWRLHRDKLRDLNCQSVRVWASAGKTLPLTSLHAPPVLVAICQLLSTVSAALEPVSNLQHQLITERW